MTGFPTRQIARLTEHNGQVLAVTYSSGSGTYILTGGVDRTVRLFNPTSARPLVQKYSAHGYEVLDLCISTDNARFLSSGGDKTIFLWDVAAAQTTRRFAGHLGKVNAVRFAGQEESLVVSGSYDGTVKLWDLKQRSERPLMTLSEAKDSVSAVEVVEHEVLVGSVDGRVRAYDFRMGLVDTDVLGVPVTSLTIAKSGDSYLVGTLDDRLRLMDRRDGKCLQTFRDSSFSNRNYRLRSTFAAADALVVCGSEDGHIFVWDVLTGSLKTKLRHGQDLLTQSSDTPTRPSESKKDLVSAVAWNQLRKQMASAGGDGSVVIWGE